MDKQARVAEQVYAAMKKIKKVHGPYKRKDGRKHVVIVYTDNSKRTQSYPRYLVEQRLGRKLLSTEDVHHRDDDYTNDAPSNLEVIDHAQHCREHSTKYDDFIELDCVYCGTPILLDRRQQQRREGNKNRGKHGPFCDRVCSGRYGADLQNHRVKRV